MSPSPTPTPLHATARIETWALAQPFVIARGASSEARVVVVEIFDGLHRGRGEGCPIRRYGQTAESVAREADALLARLAAGADWDALHAATPPGAARNAVDCALWDLRAKQAGRRAWELLGLPAPRPVATAYTLSIGTPEAMAQAARAAQAQSVLKLKLDGSDQDLPRVDAVRAARPDARLIVDANEAWSLDTLRARLPRLAALGVELIEQPLPAGADAALAELPRGTRAVPLAADESCHTRAELARCAALYDVVNIKLDKTGGLTEALPLQRAAQAQGLGTMVGCMVGTSLAMAPAMLLAPACRFVDLDGPLLIGRDRPHGLRYRNGRVGRPHRALWG